MRKLVIKVKDKLDHGELSKQIQFLHVEEIRKVANMYLNC